MDWPDAVNDKVGNILLSRIIGADVRLVEAGFGIGFKDSWQQALEDVRAAGGTPYAIPAGASDHRLGGLGFASWAVEVQQQERELGVFFDTIVVCSVTGSTQAGMIAGFAGEDRPRSRAGHRRLGEDSRDPCPGGKIAQEHRRTHWPRPRPARRRDHRAEGGTAPGLLRHPRPVHPGRHPRHRTPEGTITDPVYEGKSMAGLIDLVRAGEIDPRDSTVLYAHLGGQPALNAYSGVFH